MFQIPLDTPANLDSDRKWVNLEVVDIRFGEAPVKKKVFIRKKSFTGYRSRVVRKISRRASIKRNKTFTIPMSKYAMDADAFVLMYNLTDNDTMNSISQRWLFVWSCNIFFEKSFRKKLNLNTISFEPKWVSTNWKRINV